jgi:Ca-activated chloride channel family protein
MSFIWPSMLWTLALIPIGLLLVTVIDARRRRRLADFGAGARATAGRPARAGRLASALLLIGGLAALGVALARPQAVVALPRQEGTVILAFDVSRSMAATDLSPTRMDAARAAAKDFVSRQPSSVAVGVVAFSDAGISVQTPTTDQATVLDAIDRLAPQKGTSVAAGILASLDAIAKQQQGYNTDYYTQQTATPTATPTPVPAGVHAPAAIVLLSDGENNENPDPMQAAQQAADRGIRIYTIGLGTAAGTNLTIDGFQVHTQLDEATLQGISQLTGGTYYNATDAQQLLSIYAHRDHLSGGGPGRAADLRQRPDLSGLARQAAMTGATPRPAALSIRTGGL